MVENLSTSMVQSPIHSLWSKQLHAPIYIKELCGDLSVGSWKLTKQDVKSVQFVVGCEGGLTIG